MLKQKEWIEVIVAKTGCTKKEAKLYYDCVFDYMREQISPDEAIKISGFGVLKLRKTKAKEQINLITQKPEIVPEHNVITFKPYFEIDPKPEAIEVEDEDVIPMDEPVVEVFENKEETPVVEEKAEVEEKVEEPQVEEKVEEPCCNSEFVWVFNEKDYTTCEVKAMLKEQTTLSEKEIENAVNVVIDNMKRANKSSCTIQEDDESFDFVITK